MVNTVMIGNELRMLISYNNLATLVNAPVNAPSSPSIPLSERAMPTQRIMSKTFLRLFIALIPPQKVQVYAEQLIQELRDRFQTNTAKAPPHITLQAPFDLPADRLDELKHCLRHFAASHPPIPVLASGFAAFAPRVLFINVQKTANLLKTQAELAEALEKTLQIVDSKSKHRAFSPHITVASRQITPALFQKIWSELQSRSVEFEFTCDRLTLLAHNGQVWEIQAEFPFPAAAS